MQYIFLIYAPESDPTVGEPAFQEMLLAHRRFAENAMRRGVYTSGAGLRSTAAATTVRVRQGDRIVTDGPFAETREHLGGFYILDCKDLDEAVEYAARIPGAEFGSIEVRPTLGDM
jgi:hypothetical protein